ncbi:glycosyltransferase family 1 protein [Chamaesiphon minutus]|uniref:Glycosyltransferase n=1 Tax=Chamaesiphon minutus (strain ATCC 27169 / PCC 6605) TaxID=1173020 RepID=K9ULR8_CHAP6|nr:glycosyltransferase family 1 protein [Chamaesiphon minutus]AFY95366.1 glycosyltransferase [Chamaesiphon minutus PCC 6605]
MNLAPDRPPIKILQVVGMMNRGGAETWLMHVLRNIDRNIFQIDFLVSTTDACAYDDEIRALGGRVIPCTGPSNPLTYARKFQQVLQEYGPYDVVHSHIHHYNGYILRLADRAGVPIRVCHSHIDSTALEAKSSWLRRLYFKLMTRWIDRHATIGLGCSDVASANLFGKDWQKDSRWQKYYCSIDLTPFETKVDPRQVRAELGIPAAAFAIGHVGRFQEQKNHTFLVDIFAQVLKREPQAYLLLIGDGPLRAEIERQVERAGLAERTLFTGSRPDVPNLMMGAMDAFVMPSLCEGLPLVGIEVQAAGLQTFLSEAITPEVCLVEPLVRQLSLSQPAAIWADEIVRAHRERAIDRHSALKTIQQSTFNIQVGIDQLMKVYRGDRPDQAMQKITNRDKAII